MDSSHSEAFLREAVFLRGRARRIRLGHLDKAEFGCRSEIFFKEIAPPARRRADAVPTKDAMSRGVRDESTSPAPPPR